MIKITINKEKCIGCGSCEAICPKTFQLKGDKAVVKKQPKELTCEKEADGSCPTDAIKIQE